MKPIQIDVKTSLQPVTFRNELGEELTLVTPLSIEQFIALQGDASSLSEKVSDIDKLMEELGKNGDATILKSQLETISEVGNSITTSVFGKGAYEKFMTLFRGDTISAFVAITKFLRYMGKPEMVELVGEKFKEIEEEVKAFDPIKAMEDDKELESQFEKFKEMYGEDKILKMVNRPKK